MVPVRGGSDGRHFVTFAISDDAMGAGFGGEESVVELGEIASAMSLLTGDPGHGDDQRRDDDRHDDGEHESGTTLAARASSHGRVTPKMVPI